MSQVFPFRASMIKWALLFKDSISEAASPNRCCAHAALLTLDLAGLRRGLARNEFGVTRNRDLVSTRDSAGLSRQQISCIIGQPSWSAPLCSRRGSPQEGRN